MFVKLTQVNQDQFLFIVFCSFVFNGLLIEIHHLYPFEKKYFFLGLLVTFFFKKVDLSVFFFCFLSN